MVIYDKFKFIILPFINFLSTILIISTIQWASIQFLANYCSTSGWLGPIYNLFSLGSPLCHFVNNVQIALSQQYINIWGGTGVAIITWFTQKNKKTYNNYKKQKRKKTKFSVASLKRSRSKSKQNINPKPNKIQKI